MRDKRLILGVIKRIVRKENLSIAQLQPLFEAATDLSSWTHEYSEEEISEEFPNRGLVSWIGARPGLEQGTPWQFRIEGQDFNPQNRQHDAFKVASPPNPVREVLDLRKYGTSEEVRILITEQGIQLPFSPSESVYLRVEDDKWIGPVHLQRSEENGYWVLAAVHEGLAPLPLHRAAASDDVVPLKIGGLRHFLTPAAELGPKEGSIDWSPDTVVIKRVLGRARKLDPNLTESLQLTQKGIDRAAEVIPGADRELHEQQIKRANSVVSRVAQNLKLTAEFMEDLLQAPSVAMKLDKVKKEAILTAEAAFESQNAGEKERLQGILREIERSQQTLKELDGQISGRREALAHGIETLDGEMRTRLQAILEMPAKFLADIGIVRAGLGIAAQSGYRAAELGRSVEENASADHAYSLTRQFENWEAGSEIRDFKQLRQALGASFRNSGLSIVAARGLHAAFVSGKVPLLCGTDSNEVLRAYASCIAGGRVLWVPISPGLLEPSDLFGRTDFHTGRFVPRPGGLIDLMVEASRLEGLSIVILDGVNRSSVDAYLSPLIACYMDAQTENVARRLAIMHPSTLAKNDPYTSISTLAWPANVLLVGILANDVTSIPPSTAFWINSPLVWVERSENTEIASATKQSAATGVFPSRSWIGVDEWRKGRRSPVQKDAAPLVKAWSELADEKMRLPTALQEACRSFYAATLAWPTEPKTALQETLENCLVPYVVAKGKEDQLTEIAERVAPDGEAFRARIDQVREVLS